LGILDVQKVLAPGGAVARAFAKFEYRPEQVQMAGEIQKAFIDGRHLVIEAGTGVGKSFAYLVPSIELVGRGGGKKGADFSRANRVLISTFTITLQEQLVSKDIPFLASCLPRKFVAVLAKGRGNYLCRRRLEFALRSPKILFDESGSVLDMVRDWAQRSEDGSLSDIPFVPNNYVWDLVKSEHGNCRGRKCIHFKDCFYQRARRRLDSADIVVANHALMFSDLVLKEQGASVLPDYKYIVIDEAHNIEHVAENHFGIDISNRKISFLLNGLYNPRTHRGFLVYMKAEKAIDIVCRTVKAVRNFFKKVNSWYEANKDEFGGKCYKDFVDDTISEHLNSLRLELAKLANRCEDVDEKLETMRFISRCRMLAEELDCFLTQKRPEHVYWVEMAGGRKTAICLKSAAVNVGPDVKRCLFDRYESVILTSATLSSEPADRREGFGFFAGRIGLDDFRAVKLNSPFNYEQQVTVYIEKDLPNPNDEAFIVAAAEVIKKYMLQTKGRTFVLFTSYQMLEQISERINNWLVEHNIELLQQGAGTERTKLLNRFRRDDGAVLFGTDSFWQGVDVPGEALSSVIIVRLPFAVPNKPLLAGRLERIREQGGDPFYDYQLPFAIIKFKQGFGRLVRNRTDKGIVVVLDSRIVNRRYGLKFLAAIPKCKTEIVVAND